MYNIWSNSNSKTHDLVYINNNLNRDFLNKYVMAELWLKKLNNYYFNYLFINTRLIYVSKFYYMLNNAFCAFLKYNSTIKLITDVNPILNDINLLNIIKLNHIIMYVYKILFYTTSLNVSYLYDRLVYRFNLISFLTQVREFNLSIMKIIWFSNVKNNNNDFVKSFSSYFEFFTNYINFLNEKNKPAHYLQSLMFVMHNNNLYRVNYQIKNISNLFMYNWVKYTGGYYICTIGVALVFLVFFFSIYRINIWWYIVSLNLLKILYVLFFINNVLRLSKKLGILLCIFFLTYITNLFLYSEINIEYINTISVGVVGVFMAIVVYFLYKYNIYFFTFLELSIIAGKSSIYVFKQYFRDLLNILAYLLRLFLLFVRLNIYDGLDDFFDSYYIFIGDFDTYDYLEIIYLYGCNSLPTTYDNLYDRSVLNYEELEFYLNLFYLYAILLFKFLIFLILLLEGGFRLLLASYIFILVILEINNFNVIFIEHKNY